MKLLRGIAEVALALALTAPSAYAQEPTAGEQSGAPAEKSSAPQPTAEPMPATPVPVPMPAAVPPAALPPPTPAPVATFGMAVRVPVAPLRIEGPGGSSIRLGILVQPQYMAVNSPALSGYANNFYVRRTRILLGGTVFDKIEYFLDTDYPNLFLPSNVAPAGSPESFEKNTPGMNIQDVFITYKALGDMLKVDMGYMLPPMGHNALQGATTLYSWDYFSYTFQHGNRFGSSGNPFGRDVGLQLRGLLVGGLIEYRVGLFQGLRDNRSTTELEARNFFRVTGRLQINLLDPEAGFFYAGSYLGTKKIASIGGAFDVQDDYKYFAGDALLDMPLGPGVITAQVNFAYWNGGTFIPRLVRQKALMGEAGYVFGGIWLSPIVRAEHLWGSGNVADETRVGGGVAFWPYGHNTNVKAFYTYAKTSGISKGTHQFNVQWQVFLF